MAKRGGRGRGRGPKERVGFDMGNLRGGRRKGRR